MTYPIEVFIFSDSVQQYQQQTNAKDIYDPETFISPIKSKLKQLHAQNLDNRSRPWTRQSSPVTWMTGMFIVTLNPTVFRERVDVPKHNTRTLREKKQ